MEAQEYLASFGRSGEFGRFRTDAVLNLHRGERVVVHGPRGVEVAEVLRRATPRHADFLPNTSVGRLLRRLTAADEQSENQLRFRAQKLFERGTLLAAEMGLPLLLIDVEVLLDGEHAVLHQLREEEADVRPFVSTLSREFALHIILVNLSRDRNEAEAEEDAPASCGRPDCGQREDGECGSGGCDSCGSSPPPDMQRHFATLREQMERRRTALL